MQPKTMRNSFERWLLQTPYEIEEAACPKHQLLKSRGRALLQTSGFTQNAVPPTV
jgi:hypothetical protein